MSIPASVGITVQSIPSFGGSGICWTQLPFLDSVCLHGCRWSCMGAGDIVEPAEAYTGAREQMFPVWGWGFPVGCNGCHFDASWGFIVDWVENALHLLNWATRSFYFLKLAALALTMFNLECVSMKRFLTFTVQYKGGFLSICIQV